MVALVGDGETYKSSATGKSQAMWGYSKLGFGAHSLPLPLSSSPPLPTSFSIPLPLSLSPSLPSQGIWPLTKILLRS